MKVSMAVMVAVALFCAPAYAFSADLSRLHISLVVGDVQINTLDVEDWGAAALNVPLLTGDQVWVPPGGRVELQLSSGSYIRLDESSMLYVLSLEKDASQFYLSHGRVYVYNNAPRGGMIQVDTPAASTRSFVRSVFRVDMADQHTAVAVYKRSVETENRVGQARINAGQMVTLAENTNGATAPIGTPDSWERWNKERDERIRAITDITSRFLPPELRAYAADLDAGGRWGNVPDYGYCWTPKITAGTDWTPYRLGSWAWIDGDYVWISDDPWGWAPYHYGRWAFIASIGWCWIPPVAGDVYWGPGFVGWARTDVYVAWVPLAPGEIYYGRGYHGLDSVNIANVNAGQVNITNVYKNVYVDSSVTIVGHHTFATGSPRFVHLTRDIIERQIFAKNNISVGAPAIKPAKSSYFMSARTIPLAKRPPPPLRDLQVRQLKKLRLVRDRNKSVLNPEESPGQLPLIATTSPRTPGKGSSTILPDQPPVQERPDSGAPGSYAPGSGLHGEVKDHPSSQEHR